MKNKKHEGLNLIRDVFDFLIKDYGFKEINSDTHTFYHYIELINSTTLVRINYEVRSFGYNISFKQVRDKTVLDEERIGLGEIVYMKSPESQVYSHRAERYNEISSKQYLELSAINLKSFASEILIGDFSIWDEVLNNRDPNIY